MIGFLYILTSLFSDAGARVKEFWHDTNAHVDPRTDTYMGYDGALKDSKTKQLRHWGHDEKGDEVLYNKNWKVVKNISEEEREKALKTARNNPDGKTVCATNQTVEASYTNGVGFVCTKKQSLYLDLETGKKLIKIRVPDKFTGGRGEMEFYAYAANPLHILRISDEQRELEMKYRSDPKNWIDHPEKEQLCIDKFNNATIGMGERQINMIKW